MRLHEVLSINAFECSGNDNCSCGCQHKTTFETADFDWESADEPMPVRTIKDIARRIFAKKYPDAKITLSGSDNQDGSVWIRTVPENYSLLMSCSAQMNEIVIFIQEAYAGDYRGVTGPIVAAVMTAALRRWGQPPDGIHLVPHEDTSSGWRGDTGSYWQKLANQLGIKYSPNSVKENFADGRHPEDKGDSRRHGIPKKASLSKLDKITHSKSASPRKKQLAHWQANMRRGREKH